MGDELSDLLPNALLRYLPDSELEVHSWEGNKLTIKVTKEICSEVGLLEFDQVSHVNLPPILGIAGIRVGSSDDLPHSYFETYSPSDQRLDPEQRVFFISGSWGEEYFVIAQKLSYSVNG